jgi:hypothetical protein
MRKYLVFVIFIFFILSLNCKKQQETCPIFFPVKPGAKLNFISYVTNRQNEILYPFEYFERRYIYTDTVASRVVHHYVEKNRLSAFYTDDSCTIWHRTGIDLSALATSCGFTYQDSVYLSFWKPVIKVYKGMNTKWNFKADTTFSARASDGTEHLLQYEFSGAAKYKSWSEVVVPQNREKKLKVRQVQWNPVKYWLFDRTSNDTLYFQYGTASDYFEPELGLVRSTHDYDVEWKDKPKVFRKSTWELYQIFIPSQ